MATLQAGTLLGPYQVREILGSGGMGEVYLATDTRLGRAVAIKILAEHLAKTPDALKRFEREARAVAALSHPNILTIYDVGSQDGISYVVMEFLKGETLRSRLIRSKLSGEEAIPVAIEIATGLAAAHSSGVIHRDLKPENIFLTTEGRVKILDFGLARLTIQPSLDQLSSMPTRSSFQTKAGLVMGTLAYMSPEQLRGESVDPRSDIFSFGCILYEMLTGKNPFARTTNAETVAAILKEDVTFSQASEMSQSASIVRRCLDKNPNERFQSAQDVTLALKHITKEASVQKTSLQQVSRFGGISFSTMAKLLVQFARSKGRRQSRPAIESLAVIPFSNESRDAEMEYLSDGITESLMNNLAQLPNLRVTARSSVFRYKGTTRDPQEVGRQLKVEAILTGRVNQRGDELLISTELMDVRKNTHLWGHQYNRKMSDVFAIQEEISREIARNLQLRLTGEQKQLLARRYTEDAEAFQLYWRGRFYWNQRTPEGARKGIECFQQSIQKDPNYALAYAGLSDCYRALEQMSPARETVLKALDMDPTLAEAYQSMARILFNHDWDWAASEQFSRRAIELNPNYVEAHHSFSHLLVALGRIEESLVESQTALELAPIDPAVITHMAWHYLMDRRNDLVMQYSGKTLELDPKYYPATIYLGTAYLQEKQYEKAISEFEKGIAISPESTDCLAMLAYTFGIIGRKPEAVKILNDWSDQQKPIQLTPLEVAIIYLGLGERDQAIEWLQKAYEARSAELVYLNVNPIYDTIRNDPRFQALVQKMRLKPSAA